jgi:hypothetical protein
MRGTVRRVRRTGRPGRRRLAAEQLLEANQRPGDGVRVAWRQGREQRRQAFADRVPGRAQRLLSHLRECELLAAPVRRGTEPADQTGLLQGCDELGDRGGRDSGAPGQLRADHLTLGDRLQREELARRERRLVRRERALDPAGGERGDAPEGGSGLGSTRVWT